MSLSPRAIAMQGIGYGALLVALHGLVGVEPVVEPPVVPVVIGSVSSRPPQLAQISQTALQRRIHEEDEFIIAFVVSVVQSGLLEDG